MVRVTLPVSDVAKPVRPPPKRKRVLVRTVASAAKTRRARVLFEISAMGVLRWVVSVEWVVMGFFDRVLWLWRLFLL
jgi:hypothetical protein